MLAFPLITHEIMSEKNCLPLPNIRSPSPRRAALSDFLFSKICKNKLSQRYVSLHLSSLLNMAVVKFQFLSSQNIPIEMEQTLLPSSYVTKD